MRTLIVGGVAAGMSAAARLRRLDADASIVVVERGGHVSFANCGLPYHLGGAIEERSALLLQTPDSLSRRFGIDVRVRHEVVGIDRDARVAHVRDLDEGTVYPEAYDHLVLAPGAAPFVPAIPGAERGFTLRSIEDLDRLVAAVDGAPTSAVVVGGGFIGLEVAENLTQRGIGVTLVEAADQVLTPLDPEMAAVVQRALQRHGVGLEISTTLAHVGAQSVTTAAGAILPADLVVFAVGVRPDTALAEACGLRIGPRGGIAVDAEMRTSDPCIFAVGDAAEKTDAVDGAAALVPLANLANRHGRRAADAIAGYPVAPRPAQGTAIVKVFDVTAALTGWSEKRARAGGRPTAVVHTHGTSHADYFPGAERLSLKLVYDPTDGTILGAQAVGGPGVDKRIDVLATAQMAGLTAPQLADLELAYAPPFGSAKDPVNILGYVAENRLGAARATQWHELSTAVAAGAAVVDVRSPEEYAAGHIPGAVNVPVDTLSPALVPDGPLIVYCAVGQRAHVAAMALANAGRDVANLDGGWLTWEAATAGRAGTAPSPQADVAVPGATRTAASARRAPASRRRPRAARRWWAPSSPAGSRGAAGPADPTP